jgi:hypothetical protein
MEELATLVKDSELLRKEYAGLFGSVIRSYAFTENSSLQIGPG